MVFSQLLKMKRHFVRPSKSIGDMGIHLPLAFKKVLERECARADRTRSHLALVRFGIGCCDDSAQLQARLIGLLKKRMRLTDELGWLEDHRVGLLLFNTDAADAFRFISGLKHNGLGVVSNIRYDVYVYPSDKAGGTKLPSGFQLKAKLSRPPGPHPRRDQRRAMVTTPCGGASTKSPEPRPRASTAGRTDPGSIKGLLLKVPLWKRILDIIGATTALVIFSPLFLIVTIFIKSVSPGPIFFRQARIGYKGRVFRMWKFRTMPVDVEQSAHQQLISNLLKFDDRPMNKLAGDARIIPMGKFLRKCCIDELPQLINVLRGEMSLVGPRPDPVYAIDHYHNWYTARFDVLPGMTGLWQVSGKNQLSFQQMMRLDIAYARQQAFWLDLKILFITIPAIVWNAKYDA